MTNKVLDRRQAVCHRYHRPVRRHWRKRAIGGSGAIAESGSEHPLGQAVVRKAKEEGLPVSNPESFEAVPGRGLSATYAGYIILIGNRKMMDENGIEVVGTGRFNPIKA